MASVAMTGARRQLSNYPQLSVSVVTYNNAHCLPVFLDSLRQQTGDEVGGILLRQRQSG
jgi:hypothetical protein